MQTASRRTDLARECLGDTPYLAGTAQTEYPFSHGEIHIVDVQTPQAASVLGKPCGRYVTITTGRLWLMDDAGVRAVERAVRTAVCELMHRVCPWCKRVLYVGLGNRLLTVDAIGARVLDRLPVTRHLKEQAPELAGEIESAAFVPGVVGQTGIETAELVKGAVDHVRPDVVIVIDALAARSTERLATTIQLTDTGISPGSGMGNHRMGLTEETLGIPVLAVGIPTIVDSATLVLEALAQAGMSEELPEALSEILENGRSFFVTRKDSDLAVESLSTMLANALTGVPKL